MPLLIFPSGVGTGAAPVTYKHVLEVVRLAFLASSLPAQLSDAELHEGTAKQRTALPYATVVEVSDVVTDNTTSGPTHRTVELQFSIHAAYGEDAKDIAELFKEEFDRAALEDLELWEIPLCTASLGLKTKGKRKGPRGEDLHTQTVNVECYLTRK